MENEDVTISKKEYENLRRVSRVDSDLLEDIARGIKDILRGKVKEI